MQRTDHLAALKECPFGGIDDLADDAPKGFDAAAAAKGDDRAIVNQTDQRDDPLLLQCATGNEDGTLLYGVAAAALPPTELKDYISRTLTDATAEFEATSSFRGGTLLPFCTKPDEGADVKALCATAWYDKQLMAAIFTTGRVRPPTSPRRGSRRTSTTSSRTSRAPTPTRSRSPRRRASTIDSAAGAGQPRPADRRGADRRSRRAGRPDRVPRRRPRPACSPRPRAAWTSRRSTADPFFSICGPSDDGDPPFALCVSASEDNANQYGVLVGQEPPDDFEAYVKRSAQTDDVTFDEPVEFRGGALHAYCGTSNGGNPFCETDWVSGDLQVGIFAAFDGVTSDDTNAALTAAIDEILAVTTAADASQGDAGELTGQRGTNTPLAGLGAGDRVGGEDDGGAGVGRRLAGGEALQLG